MVVSKILRATIADTPEKREMGLMFRRSLPSDHGMLFSFPKKQRLAFWMANTYIPLQIAFVDDDGKIGEIRNMAPLSTRAIRSSREYRYALETCAGWFDKNGIVVGAQVAMPQQGQQGQGQQAAVPTNPDVVIQQSFEDILHAAEDYGMPSITISYQSVEGPVLPNKSIGPPFEFKESEEGYGYVTAWDNQKGRYSSFRLENILGLFDEKGNPIQNEEQIRQLLTATPPTKEDQRLMEGKLPPNVEVNTEGNQNEQIKD